MNYRAAPPSMRLNEGLPIAGERLPRRTISRRRGLNEGLPIAGERPVIPSQRLSALVRPQRRAPHCWGATASSRTHPIILILGLNEGLPIAGERPAPGRGAVQYLGASTKGSPLLGSDFANALPLGGEVVASTKGSPLLGSDTFSAWTSWAPITPQRRAPHCWGATAVAWRGL